jgi:hypothetical protein
MKNGNSSFNVFFTGELYMLLTLLGYAMKAYGRVELHSFLTSAQDRAEQSASHAGCLKKESPIPTEWEIGWPGSGH